MDDLSIAALLMGFLIALAIAAPIWGYDSRDGVDSDQPARRIAWLQSHNTDAGAGQGHRSAGLVVAGALRSLARRLDADVAADERVHGTAAGAC